MAAALRAQDTTPPSLTVEQRLKALEDKNTKSAADTLQWTWKDGLRVENGSKDTWAKIGMRMQVDAMFGHEDNDLQQAGKQLEDGAEFRRARFYLNGMVTDYFEYKFQYDFADANKVKLADVWGEVKKIDVVGNFRVGQFYEPINMEQNTSDFDSDFGDRSLNNAFAPARNVGAAVHDKYTTPDTNLSWWLGAFVDDGSGDPVIAQGDGDHAITGRIAFAPLCKEDDTQVVHVGIAGSYRTPTNEMVRYAARPEQIHLAPFFVDTGTMQNVTSVKMIDGEAAVQFDCFHASAEYTQSRLEGDGLGDPNFSGWMVGAGWFLTGEHQAYNRNEAVFGAAKVKNPYGKDGWGALELAARYSHIDLNDAAVNGGEATDVIVGLNWLLTNNCRTALDVTNSHVKDVGSANILTLWFQVTL